MFCVKTITMKNNYFKVLANITLTFYATISLSQEIQTFNLGTLSEEEITTKNGTIIYFDRSSFNLKKTSNLVLKFKKNSSVRENQLPFSLRFFSDGKEIGLKKGEKLEVFSPFKNIKFQKHFILNSKNESGKIKWLKANDFYEQVFIELGGDINLKMYLHKDSIIKKLRHKNRDFLTSKEYNKKYSAISENDYINFLNKKYTYINSDFFVQIKKKINFQIKHLNNVFFSYDFYIVYKNNNAIIHSIKFDNEKLIFKNIPVFEQTYLIVISQNKNHNYYYDKIELNESLNDKKFNLNLKKISKEKLKSLFKK